VQAVRSGDKGAAGHIEVVDHKGHGSRVVCFIFLSFLINF
jgi:hypothetical protein